MALVKARLVVRSALQSLRPSTPSKNMSNAHEKQLARLREAFERTAHTKPFEAWLAWLLKHWPGQYKDRDQSKYPTARLPGSAKKVMLMRRRQANGVHIYHEKDIGHQPDVRWFVRVLSNGAPVREGIHSESAIEEDEAPDKLPTPKVMAEWLERRGVDINKAGKPCPYCTWTYTVVRDGRTFCSWCKGERT